MPVDYLQKPLFRMVHCDNLEYLLRHGICTRNHGLADPAYIGIGDNELIQNRQEYAVRIIPPGGNLGDYIPFYFGGHSPMLYRIIHGYNVQKREQADIIFIVCSIESIVTHCPDKWCFTDGHAKTAITRFFNSLQDLDKVDWETVKLQYWHDCDEDWDRRRKKQAEFLVMDYVPTACITELIVLTQQKKEQLEDIIKQLGLTIPVTIDTQKNYYYP